MIGRIIRATVEAIRRPDARAQREDDLRTRLQQRERELRAQAKRMLVAGLRAEVAVARDGMLLGAAAAAARAEALHWTLGGDADAAAGLTLEAEAYDRRAAQAAAEPVEGAHA